MIDTILDAWAAGRTAYQIGCDFPWSERTILRIIEAARRFRDPRAVLHRYPNGRFTGRQRAAQRAITLWPQIRIVTVRHNQRKAYLRETPVLSRQARAA